MIDETASPTPAIKKEIETDLHSESQQPSSPTKSTTSSSSGSYDLEDAMPEQDTVISHSTSIQRGFEPYFDIPVSFQIYHSNAVKETH